MTERDDALVSWADYRRHVVSELERLNTLVEKFDAKLDRLSEDNRREIAQRDLSIWKAITDLKVDIGMLKAQAGAWGATAGVISSGIVAMIVGIIELLFKK
jgi:hypothetical protein